MKTKLASDTRTYKTLYMWSHNKEIQWFPVVYIHSFILLFASGYNIDILLLYRGIQTSPNTGSWFKFPHTWATDLKSPYMGSWFKSLHKRIWGAVSKVSINWELIQNSPYLGSWFKILHTRGADSKVFIHGELIQRSSYMGIWGADSKFSINGELIQKSSYVGSWFQSFHKWGEDSKVPIHGELIQKISYMGSWFKSVHTLEKWSLYLQNVLSLVTIVNRPGERSQFALL